MKSFLLTLLFVSVTSFSFSQEVNKDATKDQDKKSTIEDAPEIKWGVRAGFNISNLDFSPDPTFENKHRNGFVFGAFYYTNLTMYCFRSSQTFHNFCFKN
ncbi:hypothetical protein EB822_04570 [Flavobacteriaceae bacterium PRS1]|nr:hypothetical protein EB822_04570 [Flavobacteriaceae bacterium PRS1]